jgi:hypothetical protein|tara:strand:+ start:16 stop:561 length:546 start_codon:yes stop_codon:yes gene_type:complete
MEKGKLEYVAYLVLTIAISFLILIGISKSANAQQQTVFVECTSGDFPSEITWQILTCNGGVLLEGISPYLGAVVLPQYYQISMQDSYGDGWNNAYLYIDEIEYGFLSDVDWIDSIGTWPQEFKDQIIDVGCLTIGIEEVGNTNFIPTHYYDILGREVKPVRGFYIASDGVLTRKVYIDETK